MAQHHNEHLTITELSAYIDEELAPEELAFYDAHIQTCQPCQAALADLRLTSALLGSMPQVAVPRSFALPTNLVLLPETPDLLEVKTFRGHSSQAPRIWRRSLRVASTLVALLGLLFFLAGAFSALPHTAGTSTSSNSSASMPLARPASGEEATSTAASASTPQRDFSPDVRATHAAAMLTPTLISSQPTPSNTQPQDQAPTQAQVLPAVLDLGQPQGRLSIGAALLLLGILGALVARLPRKTH